MKLTDTLCKNSFGFSQVPLPRTDKQLREMAERLSLVEVANMDLSSVGKTNPNLVVPYESPVPRQVAEEQRTLIQAVKAVSAAALFGQDNELTFVLDRSTRQAVVRIVNRETREIVDQIPGEYVLRMAEELKRSQAHVQQRL